MAHIESNPEWNKDVDEELAEQQENNRLPHLIEMSAGEFDYFAELVSQAIKSEETVEQPAVTNEQ